MTLAPAVAVVGTGATATQPDHAETARYLEVLTGSADARVTFQTFDDSDEKRAHLAAVFVGTLAQHAPELGRLNRAGAGVFVQVNEGDGRGKAAIRALRALFVDDDCAQLTPAALELAPSMVVQSKNGIHAYWRLRTGQPLDAFTPAQLALADALGTDRAVKNLDRVMRLPGFFHVKDPSSPFMVRVLQSSGAAYDVQEVLDCNGASIAAAVEVHETPRVQAAPRAFDRAQRWLLKRKHAVEGGRNDAAIATANELLGFDLDDGEVLDLLRVWNRGNQPPLEDGELRKVASNARKYRQNPPGEKLARGGAAAESVGEPARTRIRPVRLSLEDVRHPSREQFVLGSMFPFGKSSAFFGPTGVGKTALEAMIAVAYAAGAQSLWGLALPPGGGAVLVWTVEDTLDDWKRKLAAIAEAGGFDVERALERIHIVDRTEQIVRLCEVATVRVDEDGKSITRRRYRLTQEHADLVDDIRETAATYVPIDTTSRLVDDEDNAHFAGLQSALGAAARVTGAAVVPSHHATKAATRENDSAIESARGGGAFTANARNAVSLFPAEPDVAAAYEDRFQAEDLFTLAHGKATSSTKRQQPLTLVRCSTSWGAVFRLPGEIVRSPEEDAIHNARMEVERQREREQLGRLYDVVAEKLRIGPVSPSRLRDGVTAIGVRKQDLEALVLTACKRGVLRTSPFPNGRGVALELGDDPRH